MVIRFSATNIVAMILFIPLLIALGIILAFVIPLLAIIGAVLGIGLAGTYTFSRIASRRSRTNGKQIEVKDYRIR